MAKENPPAPVVHVAPFTEPGQPAPDFKLADQAGATHALKDFRGQWLVIYFYPKDDTPGCTTEACQFRDGIAEFKKRGVAVVGVSPDNEKAHAKFAAKFSLPFPLLADVDKAMVGSYGVWKEKSMYGRKYMGVERTTYLIDPKGKVAHRWEKVKVTDHDADVLKKIDELGKAGK
ncbi:MAG: thioredoxin-dependent thiol peroxidase [Planctomycetota bacterium]|nr:thioredoxin-dependent thiol peroxidase [Planctomycetota bacterium]